MNKIYLCDGQKIVCKKYRYCGQEIIHFIDQQTDGLNFSFSIKNNFSKKNIEAFLKSKFEEIQLIN